MSQFYSIAETDGGSILQGGSIAHGGSTLQENSSILFESFVPPPGWDNDVHECLPLLKFEPGAQENAHLVEKGLQALSALDPPVSIVTILGDGRCGKSALASRLIGDEALVFPVGNTGTAVTEGIDMCIVPQPGASEGSLVVLDCEGGNNPTGALRGVVDLIAMLVSTLTVQVVWGQMSEGQLWQIGQGIATCESLLDRSSATQKLELPRLLLVVNGCHLQYAQDQLRKTFEEHKEKGPGRNELRMNIKQAYDKIEFVTIQSENHASYPSQLEAFRSAIVKDCRPASLSGMELSGAQIASMLKSIVDKLQTSGVVPVFSVFRNVIFDHLLKPLVKSLVDAYRNSLVDSFDGEFRFVVPDTRPELIRRFESETEELTHKELVAEAREHLTRRVDESWHRALDHNAKLGERDRDVSTESEMRYSHTEDRVLSWKRSCYIVGKKTPLIEPCCVFRAWTRTRVLKNNGQVYYSEWQPTSHNMDGSSFLQGTSSMTSNGSGHKRTNSVGSYDGKGTPAVPPAPVFPVQVPTP